MSSTHARTHEPVMSSGPHTAKIAELRRQADLIDQTIAALEILNGDRPMPTPTETYTARRDPAAQKLLPPAKRKEPRAKKRPTARNAKSTRVLALRPDNEADEAAVLAAVRKLGATTCSHVVQATKIPEQRVKRAKARLQKQGQLVVTGWAHGSRWSLSDSAKEAP